MKYKAILKRLAACMVAAMVIVPAIAGCGSKTESTKEPVQAEETEETEQKEEDTQADQAEKNTEEAVEKQAESSVSETSGNISGVKIDYKTSEVYTQEDMDEAIEIIEKEFSTWEGCVLYEISYTDDTKCSDNLSYINTLAVDKEYDECIVFTSSFHSPVEGGGAWEPDYDYENWEWYLGRTEGGSWDLLTWGY